MPFYLTRNIRKQIGRGYDQYLLFMHNKEESELFFARFSCQSFISLKGFLNVSLKSNLTTKPLFSVLIASYNNRRYLEECLQSIFAQTYKNWEIVIVDDASTDHSEGIYAKYSDCTQLKIFRNHENKGVGYTKRKCIEYARGAICGFLDADDALLPDALEIMVKAHLANPETSIVYSTHYICDENLKPQEIADYVGQIPAGKRSMSVLRPIISHFATFKMEKYAMTEGVSEIYAKAVDKDLYFRLEDTGPVLFIDRPLYYYRHHTNNISLNEQGISALRYELTARVLAMLRTKKNRALIDEMPYKRYQLAGSVVYVIYYEIKKKRFVVAIKLFYKLLVYSALILVNFVFRKGIHNL